jgi:hypothetical protein
MHDRPTDEAPASALARLIEVERREASALAEAESEATRSIAAAEAEVERRAGEHAEALRTALQVLQARIRAEHETAVEAIARRHAAEAERYATVDDAQVDALARWVAKRVAEGEAQT